jgi:hypothetical protein
MTDVRVETVAAPALYIPGPNAREALDALRTMRDDIDAALSAMRHTPESGIDHVRVEVIAEALHEVTRPMRRAERAHIARWTAEVQARELGTNTSEEPDDEPSPERAP